ncbi:MAG: hypothetical protein O2967_15860 [Proteobacteria bacterium]|nr:hypothetical protein [Pseudomonadota bacterium]
MSHWGQPFRLVPVLLGAIFFALGGPAQADDGELGGIPRAPGAEEAYYLCSACHSFRLVAQQGLNYARWEETLIWMVKEQEMEAPEADDLKLITNYLAKYYGPDRLANQIDRLKYVPGSLGKPPR